jgi:hypothetical protein
MWPSKDLFLYLKFSKFGAAVFARERDEYWCQIRQVVDSHIKKLIKFRLRLPSEM